MTDEDSTLALKLPARQLRALSSKATGYSRPIPELRRCRTTVAICIPYERVRTNGGSLNNRAEAAFGRGRRGPSSVF